MDAPPVLKARVLHLAVVCGLAAAMIFLYGRIDPGRRPYADWDLAWYRAMARAAPGLAADVQRPFAYRIVGPYVVGLLGGDDRAFHAASAACAVLLVGALYLFCCRVHLPSGVAAVTAVLFACNRHFLGFVVWDYFQIADALSLLLLVVLFWAMRDRRWAVFAAALLLGAATKETALLTVPVAGVYLWERRRPWSEWRAAGLAMLPGLAAFAAVRALVPFAGGQTLLDAFLSSVPKLASGRTWLRLLGNAFCPLTLLPVVFFEETVAFFKEHKHALVFVLLVFVSTLFGLNNERLMAPAFVVVYVLFGRIVAKLWASKAVVAVVVACTFLASFHHERVRYPLPSRNVTVALAIGSLIAVTGAALLWRILHRGERARADASPGDAER